MNSVQTLLRYKAWADAIFLSVVSALPESALVAPQPIHFGSLIRTLHHSYAMDFVWQCHLYHLGIFPPTTDLPVFLRLAGDAGV